MTPHDEWPLRGRDDELDAVARALDARGGVLLAGPAGVGKTRLAREALAASRGSVRLVRATGSSQPIPLGALAPLLTGVDDAPARLLARAHAALRADPALVLGIDDAHLLDEVSATLVHQLVGEGVVRVVVTVRTGEAAPAAVTALWKDGLLPRVDVDALGGDGTAALLEAALGGSVHTDCARRLHAATRGNVLWLRQLVDGERRAGRLARTEGLWTWAGEPRLTPGLTELIDARIGTLAAGVRPVVELLALAEPLDADVLAALTGPAAVDDAVARGLVTVARPEARLAHPLYGEVVRGRIGELRARALRGQVAQALADAGHEDLLRRATLALDADLDPDPKLLTSAADRAIALNDVPLGVRLLEAACAAGAGFDARVTLAYTHSYLLHPDDSAPAFADAAAAAHTPEQVARVTQMRAVDQLFVRGDADAAETLVARAEADGAELHGFRVTAATLGNRLAEARRLTEELHAGEDPPDHARALAGWAGTAAAGFVGRADALRGLATEATAAALACPETATLQTNIAFVETFGHALAGRPGVVRERIDVLAGTLVGLFPTFMLPVFEGMHALVTGHAVLAARRLVEYRPYFPGAGGGYVTWFESMRAIACALGGDAAGARESLDRAQRLRLPAEGILGPLLDLAGAWTTAADGVVSAAADAAVAAAEHAAATGQWATEVLARQDATLLGSRTQAPRLRELARRVDGPRAGLAATHAAALAAGDAEALLAVSSAFEEAGLLLGAAEAAAHAADLLRRRGGLAAGNDAAGRATVLATSCGLRTPSLAAVARPLELSARQREIAALAARMSNHEIAARLGVSVRTVEGHVYHSCVRLGLANRAELAAYVTGDMAPPS